MLSTQHVQGALEGVAKAVSGWWRSIGAFRRTISYFVPQLPLTKPTETMPQRIAALSGILLLHSPGSHLDVTCNEYQESDRIMDVMNLISEIQISS